MNLTIKDSILSKIPEFNIIPYAITFNDDYVATTKTEDINRLIDELIKEYQSKYVYEDIPNIIKLKETRDGYKKIGKDPSHTRPACEALLRRIIKGKGLYLLGDVIDLGNILSLYTLRSVCVVDYNKLVGDVVIDIGTSNDSFNGINRDLINMDKMIVYKDSVSAFGSPTSDTMRTIVDSNTHKIFIMIICFSNNDLDNDEQMLVNLYTKYTSITKIEKINIKRGECL